MTADKKRKHATRKQAERDGMSYAAVVNATAPEEPKVQPAKAPRSGESLADYVKLYPPGALRREVRSYVSPMTPSLISDLIAEYQDGGEAVTILEVNAKTFADIRRFFREDDHWSPETWLQAFEIGRRGRLWGAEVWSNLTLPEDHVAVTLRAGTAGINVAPPVPEVPNSERSVFPFIAPLSPSMLVDYFAKIEGAGRIVRQVLVNREGFTDVRKFGRDVLHVETDERLLAKGLRGTMWTAEIRIDPTLGGADGPSNLVVLVHAAPRQV